MDDKRRPGWRGSPRRTVRLEIRETRELTTPDPAIQESSWTRQSQHCPNAANSPFPLPSFALLHARPRRLANDSRHPIRRASAGARWTPARSDATRRPPAGQSLVEQLSRFSSQMVQLCPAADEPWLWALLERAPTPSAAQALMRATVRHLLTRY